MEQNSLVWMLKITIQIVRLISAVAVRTTLEKHATEFSDSKIKCIFEALEITMSSNNGKVLDRNFTQINGATIGSPESASVTDIFGAMFIGRVVNKGNSHLHPSDWKRYRDDGWDIVEDCDENQIYQFTEYLNDAGLKDKIRYQPVVKESGLEFLDVKVHLRNGYLTPEIYSKETV